MDRDLLEPILVAVMVITFFLIKVNERRIAMREENKEVEREKKG